MFPDGTPVSDTEALLIREYIKGRRGRGDEGVMTFVHGPGVQTNDPMYELPLGEFLSLRQPFKGSVHSATQAKEGWEVELSWQPGAGHLALHLEAAPDTPNGTVSISVSVPGLVSITSSAGHESSVPVRTEGGVQALTWNVLRVRLLPTPQQGEAKALVEVWVNPQWPSPSLNCLGPWTIPWVPEVPLGSVRLLHVGNVSQHSADAMLIEYASVLPLGAVIGSRTCGLRQPSFRRHCLYYAACFMVLFLAYFLRSKVSGIAKVSVRLCPCI